MFRSFFEDYREKVYKSSLNKLNPVTMIIVVGLIVVFAVAYFAFILADGVVVKNISAVVFVLIGALLLIWSHISNKKIEKHHVEFLDNYRYKHTKELTKILKSFKYDLYSTEGIEWLIRVCQKKLDAYDKRDSSNKFGDFLSKIVIPVFSIVFASFADKLQPSVKIALSIVIIMALIWMFAVSKMRSRSIITPSSLFSDKAIVQQLLDDMEYIKVQMAKENSVCKT